MKSQTYLELDTFSATQDSCASAQSPKLAKPGFTWQYVDDVQRLLGEDTEPDPLFFVESWTLGVSAAVDNWQRRWNVQANGSVPAAKSGSGLPPGNMPFLEAPTSAERCASLNIEIACDEYLSPAPRDASAAYFLDPMYDHLDSFAEPDDCDDSHLRRMTLQRAYDILELSPTCTQTELKAAFRLKVSQWHPDRHEGSTKSVRQRATAQMAAINEAYRLVREITQG
jgi:hypothetical protein